MHTPIEVVLPGGSLTAHVTCGEWPETGNPKIISILPGKSHLDVDFTWEQDGTLWHVIDPKAKWELKVLFEQIGGGESAAAPTTMVDHVSAHKARYQESMHIGVIGYKNPGADKPYYEVLKPGNIYKVFVTLTLKVSGDVIACGFGECDTIHIMEAPHP